MLLQLCGGCEEANNNDRRGAVDPWQNGIQQIILMDDNYYLRSMRKQVFMTCQQVVSQQLGDNPTTFQIAMVSVWLDTPVEMCLERNQGRKRRVPVTVIERMSRQMEIPEMLNKSGEPIQQRHH